MYIADLHIHSRYSRATSRECVPEYLDLWARRKGIDLLGTGDFTHPAWRQELAEKLVPAEDGLYCLRKELRLKDRAPMGQGFPRFVVSGEISSIYKKHGRVRKVHNLILLPGLEEAELLSRKLETIGNIHSDGRPILGLDSRDLLEITLEICPRAIFVPAHIWTPHFSMFGAFSGFDRVEECFEDLTSHIRAFETGLSSDPPMNWRLSALDRFQMISNSDAHSPGRLGREANLLEIPMSYEGLYGAIQEGKGLAGTIEFFPEEGKYHYDGHRKCHLCLSPREAEGYHGKCPVCGRKLTLGVSHRVEQLADRAEGYSRPGAVPFESLVPLPEVIAASTGHGAASTKVQRLYEEMLGKLGTEFSILRELSVEDIRSRSGYQIAEGIRRLRQGQVRRFPGFDGEYGTIHLFEPSELDAMEGQMSLFGCAGFGPGPGGDKETGTEDRNAEKGVSGAVSEMGADGEAGAASGVQAGRVPGAASGMQDGGDFVAASEMQTAGVREAAATAEAGFPAASAQTLNEDQLLAVQSLAPAMAVMAGPGTGKTRTLVSRILYLLQNHRVRPGEITAVTFTSQAAKEMRTRLQDQLGKRGAAGKVRIGTFHAICYDLLLASGEAFTLAEEGTVLELVREVAHELGIRGNVKNLRQKISGRKTELALAAAQVPAPITAVASALTLEPAPAPVVASALTLEPAPAQTPAPASAAPDSLVDLDQAVQCYNRRLAALGVLDFDDLLIRALQMAQDQERGCTFPYLLVDEFQDISPLQYRLIRAWSQGGREVFIIGDPNQAIYGFRGADAGSFRRFCQETGAQVIPLKKNYRSTPEILAAAGKVLEGAGNAGESLDPIRPVDATQSLDSIHSMDAAQSLDPIHLLEPVQPSGLPVRLAEGAGERAEAIFAAKEINRLVGGIDMLDAQEGFGGLEERSPRSFADIAVIYRTHRQAELLETCLKKEGIPYVVTGREDFLEEEKVRGSLAFFRSLVNPGDVLSHRLCLKLLWNLGEESTSQCPYEALAEKYRKLLGRGKPGKLWESWQKDLELTDHPGLGKLSDMAVFYKTMEEMLTALAFGRESDLKRCGGKHYTSDAVTLMTIHGSKGLEFPVVLLCGVRDGLVPLELKGKDTDVEEERRLLYVAMTRAKEELVMTVSGEVSRFLKEIPEDTVRKEQVRQKRDWDGGYQMSLFDIV